MSATASKVRVRFWIIRLHRIVKHIKRSSVVCKKLDQRTATQAMGQLPEERLKPAPAWHCTAIDFFGPFKIRDEVKKRTTGKAYGVIFNCLGTTAVHVELAPDCSTEKFLMALGRFVSLRGYPAKLLSDNVTQLKAANEDGKHEVGEESNVHRYWRKHTVLLRVANSLLQGCKPCDREPIGRHPTMPEDGSYLCPNDLLLGRASPRVPSGPFKQTSNPKHRYEFVQRITDTFWRKWTRDFFPSLIVRQKWHTA